MKLIPVMTEKSMRLTKSRGYTFLVSLDLNKFQIKKLIEKAFNVNVTNIKTVNSKTGVKRNARGTKQKIKATKKAIVFLKEGEKIDLFEEEKKPAKKKTAKKKENK